MTSSYPFLMHSRLWKSSCLRSVKQDLYFRIFYHGKLAFFFPFFQQSQCSRLYNSLRLKEKEFTAFALLDVLILLMLKPIFFTDEEVCLLIGKRFCLQESDILLYHVKLYFENIILSYDKIKRVMKGLLARKRYEEVVTLYREHLTPKFYEKKNLGQVYTPFYLIHRILDQIPMSIWTNPQSTFLDPAAGMGAFLVIIYTKLMFFLKEKIPDEKNRHEHIIKNMLFGADIDPLNIAWMKKIFGPELSLFYGDSLSSGINLANELGVQRFHVIVGNPPFEKQQQKKEVAKTGGDSLWPHFVWKSFQDWLAPDGYFGMVLPPGWRKPSGEKSRSENLWFFLSKEKKIIWIDMYDTKEASELFENHVSIRIDLVVAQNKKPIHPFFTNISMIKEKDHFQKIQISKLPFLPNSHLDYWIKLLDSEKENGFVKVKCHSSVYDPRKSYVQREKNKQYRYPVIHAIHKNGSPVFLYTNQKKKEGGFGISKVLFNRLGGWNPPILDWLGSYGTSQDIFYIEISTEQEGKRIIDYFDDEKRKQFQEGMMWNTSLPSIFWKLFEYFPNYFYRI